MDDHHKFHGPEQRCLSNIACRVAETPGLARWIATFHEGTFEVVAESARVVSRAADGSPAKALDRLLGEGPNKMLDAV